VSEENKFLSVAEAAGKLGVSRGRVNKLISDGRLPALRIGRAYAIKESDLSLVENRPTGRPPKEKS
jgi:excisionase family DNA binding protein